MNALGLPKNTDEEKIARTAAIQQAYKDAAMVPFEIGELAYHIFDLAEQASRKGNQKDVYKRQVHRMWVEHHYLALAGDVFREFEPVKFVHENARPGDIKPATFDKMIAYIDEHYRCLLYTSF